MSYAMPSIAQTLFRVLYYPVASTIILLFSDRRLHAMYRSLIIPTFPQTHPPPSPHNVNVLPNTGVAASNDVGGQHSSIHRRNARNLSPPP